MRLATPNSPTWGGQGLVQGTRELLEWPYIIVYRMDDDRDRVVIVSVVTVRETGRTSDELPRGPDQIRSIPASAITLVQRATSRAISALKSSGGPAFGSLAMPWIFAITAGSATSALISALSRAAIGSGSFAGPTTPSTR